MYFNDYSKFMWHNIYVMIDIGRKSYEDKKIYTEILKTTQDKDILNRMIVGRTYYRYDKRCNSRCRSRYCRDRFFNIKGG